MPLTPKRWLTLRQAAEYAAIGRQRLVLLAKEGRVKGFQDPDSGRQDWIFDLLSLDHYRESQATQLTYHEKALAISKGLDL